jgi:hypothetical protein
MAFVAFHHILDVGLVLIFVRWGFILVGVQTTLNQLNDQPNDDAPKN